MPCNKMLNPEIGFTKFLLWAIFTFEAENNKVVFSLLLNWKEPDPTIMAKAHANISESDELRKWLG